MARIRGQKLSWKPSESSDVVGYQLYWSNETTVSYDSNVIKLGNITEVNLSDILVGAVPSGEPICLGISAVDEVGNESDIISLSEPYQISVLPAPMDLALTRLSDFKIIETNREAENQVQDMQNSATQQIDRQVKIKDD